MKSSSNRNCWHVVDLGSQVQEKPFPTTLLDEQLVLWRTKDGVHDAKEMLGYQHGGGFSVDAGVCIAASDRAGLERLLRYCTRPPFSMERLRKQGADLVYHCPKPQSGGKRADLVLTHLELIERIAALVPPPRTHRHRYVGVLAPNAPLRAVVTAMAQVGPAQVTPVQSAQATGAATGAAGASTAVPTNPQHPEPAKRSPRAICEPRLIPRIFEVFPLVCPLCAGQMRIIAFIVDGAELRKILEHIGVDAQAHRTTPARGPPLWDDCDAALVDGVDVEPEWDPSTQIAPDYHIDQRISW